MPRLRFALSTLPRRASVAGLLTLCLCVVATTGCPESTSADGKGKGGAPAQWQKVNVDVPDEIRKERQARQAEREKALAKTKRMKAKAHVERMRGMFVTDDERACLSDGDCTLTNTHCCSCNNGGTMAAINQTRLTGLLQRRMSGCESMACPQKVSDDATCSATTAVCVKGRCEVNVPASAKKPSGIGVEPIAPTPNKAPAATGK